MIISNRNILLGIVILSIVLIPVIFLTSGVPRIILSVIFVLFSPGYVLLSALFPRKDDIKLLEHLSLSFGISLAIAGSTGLILHLSPIALNANSLLFTMFGFIILCACIALIRIKALSHDNRLLYHINIPFRDWQKSNKTDKTLILVLSFVMLIFIAVLSFAAFVPNKGENYTEFYLLDQNGKADGFPSEIILGESIHCISGITSHAENPTGYKIILIINNETIKEIYTPELLNNQNWEEQITITPSQSGENQHIEFWLYKIPEESPYHDQPLRLIVNIK